MGLIPYTVDNSNSYCCFSLFFLFFWMYVLMTALKQLQYLCYICAIGGVPKTRNVVLWYIYSLKIKNNHKVPYLFSFFISTFSLTLTASISAVPNEWAFSLGFLLGCPQLCKKNCGCHTIFPLILMKPRLQLKGFSSNSQHS